MLKQIQKTFFKILEKELIVILAVLVLVLGIFFVQAQTDQTNLTFNIIPEGGRITVTYPNGGEIWVINTTKTITWVTEGPIDDVKIELQRASGGDWEELTESTINDGDFPWSVTSPTTTQALIKISKVGDDSVNDTSNAVFTISTAGGGGGGGGVIYNPAIDTVVPREFSNAVDVDMIITGFYFEWGAKVWLDNNYLQPNYVWSSEISVTVPADFPIGEYALCVQNPSGGASCYHLPIIVYEEEIIEPEEPEEPEEEPAEEPEEPEEDVIPPSTGGPASFWPAPIFGPIFDYFKLPRKPLEYEPMPRFDPIETRTFTGEVEGQWFWWLLWLLLLLILLEITREILEKKRNREFRR